MLGGLTRYGTEAEGLWREDGLTYRDRKAVYGVALRSLTDGAKVATLVSFAKRHFRQEASFIKYLGVVEIM